MTWGGGGEALAQFVAFEDTWTWDDAAQDRVDAIERAVGHPAHGAIRGLRIMLGDCGMLAYLSYMAERLAEVRRVLKPEGSVYLHCDPTASHYLKVVMDSVFGKGNFRNEIVWCYSRPSAPRQRQLSRVHDTIHWYSRSVGKWTFNPDDIRQPYAAGSKARDGYAANASKVASGAVQLHKLGKFPESWSYIPPLKGNSREYLGYPTQKPMALLDRIIKGGSNPGDVVLDPFCGCGTTIDSARKLNRRFVGIDISHFAIDIIRERRLQDKRIPVHGIPADMRTAEQMARERPFDFEKWAITRVPGMVPNAKQVGDRGIDGRGKLLDGGGLVLAQVKGGAGPSLGPVRDFLHVLVREDASFGIFATLRPITSRGAKAEAKGAGYREIGANRYAKAQLWSIADYFNGNLPIIPPLADPYTGRPMQMDMLTPADCSLHRLRARARLATNEN